MEVNSGSTSHTVGLRGPNRQGGDGESDDDRCIEEISGEGTGQKQKEEKRQKDRFFLCDRRYITMQYN